MVQRKAGRMTGFAAADFSRIRNANLGRLTIDRLMRMLASLDESVRVTVHVERRQPEQGALQVSG